jgi:NAD(P)-dependent dehydrogenase (short-subunit alcohol dehydrogenase family)
MHPGRVCRRWGAGNGTLAIGSDAGKLADIEAAMKLINERFGRIDALFVNAGIGKFVPFEEDRSVL